MSRFFGTAVTKQDGIVEAVSEIASRAAEKLRQQDSVAAAINVFSTTSPYRQLDKQHSVSVSVPLVRPTADTRLLVGTAAATAGRHFRSGFNYAKAGVMLLDLQPASQVQEELDLFSPADRGSPTQDRDRPALMSAMDGLNKRFGRDAVRIGSATLTSPPARRAEVLSPVTRMSLLFKLWRFSRLRCHRARSRTVTNPHRSAAP